MNAEQSACASSGCGSAWDQLDWARAERQVQRLQARIVKATQASRWNKVRTLQRLLTCSFYGRALAVKRVTENKGKRTPGVDGAIWKTPASKYGAIDSLRRRGYHPQPLRRVHIPKGNGKERPLGIPTMRDRAMQALFLQALAPVAETTADANSYGFRSKRSTTDAIGQCFLALRQKTSAPWVFEGDIRGCFDHISHEWMLRHIPMDKEVLRKWLRAGYVEHRTLFPTLAGTPQGGIISPTLANLVLDGLERTLKAAFLGKAAKVNFVRYADDFIITGARKELLEDEVRPLVEQFLRERALELSPEKTCITAIEDGFDFLGQNVRRFGRKLLIQPSKKNTHTFLEKARELIRRSRGWTQVDLIRQLNPILRGWAAYHRHIVASKTFRKAEAVLWQSLWRWAKRRHPQKSWKWIASRYWPRLDGRKVFAADTGKRTREGKVIWLRMINIAETKIRRHVKIKAEANPFDPQWRSYFEDRKFFQWFGVHRQKVARKE